MDSNDSPDVEAAQSVLASLAPRLTNKPKVFLRETEVDDHGPMLKTATPETRLRPRGRGNYHMVGEIARGGMGVVLKGHDTDLGRDVAIKVLHEEMAADPIILQRFVEEAQIGGQLQHPGIVPVYELGMMADERPYFTMKLVKGRTLSKHLADRETTEADRQRFLTIFHQVCQTMAYAHTREVIHRDLKPSNVMLGPFGEVQVVDWGLAKVLHGGSHVDRSQATQASVIQTVRSSKEESSTASDSIAGSVMGTPAYMSPEQARGEVEELDERTDVFSLGAILCEILTGKPAYRGTTREAMGRAADADLADAFERLAAAKADAQLVELTRSCLAADRDERPRDARIVADRVGAYLSSLEERVQAARVRAARTAMLALSGVVVLALVAGGWAWFRQDEESRRQAVDTVVASALDDASEATTRSDWDAVAASIDQGRAALVAGGAATEATQRFEQRAARLERMIEEAALERGFRERRNAFLQRAESIRSSVELAERMEGAYSELFEAAGFSLEDMDDEGIVMQVREFRLETEVARAMDQWASSTTAEGVPVTRTSLQTRLLRLATELDPDEVRSALREALIGSSPNEIIALGRELAGRDLAPATATFAAEVLFDRGQVQLGLAVLERGIENHPSDAQLRARYGQSLARRTENGLVAAIRHLTAAQALAPDSVWMAIEKARAEVYSGDPFAAIVTCRRAIELDPELPWGWNIMGLSKAAAGDMDGALESYREAIRLSPDYFWPHLNMAVVQNIQGDFAGAIRNALRGQELQPNDPAQLLLVLLKAYGELGMYEEMYAVSERLLGFFGELPSVLVDYAFELIFLDREESRDPATALEYAERASALDRSFYPLSILGLIYYRLGRHEESLAVLREASLRYTDEAIDRPYIAFLLVLPLAALGRTEEARRAYEVGEEWLRTHRLNKIWAHHEMPRMRGEAAAALGLDDR